MNIVVIQMCSVLDYKINLEKINANILMAKEELKNINLNLDAVFLPEVFYSISDGTKPTPYLIEEDNEHFKNIQNIALEHKVFLIGGTCATKVGDKILNRAYNFDPNGNLIETYDKMHLFTLDLRKHDKNTLVDETKVYSSGNQAKLLDLGNWKVGLGICFDLRFPELFRSYFKQGANILTVASAFTIPTGKAHWETLLRARAIENQSYVIAADQWGIHNERLSTYGHSMVVDPWGEIIAHLPEGEGYLLAQLDLDRLSQVRKRLNVFPKLQEI